MRRRTVLGLIAATGVVTTGSVWSWRDGLSGRPASQSAVDSTSMTAGGPVAVAILGDARVMHDAADGRIHLRLSDGNEGWRLPESGHPFVGAVAVSTAGGRLWISDRSSRQVRTFDAAGNELAVVHRGAAAGLAWDEQREWLFVSAPLTREIVAYNASGDLVQRVEAASDSVLRYPGTLAIGTGGTVYVADRENGGIVRLDAQGRVTGVVPHTEGRLFHSLVVQGGLLHAADRQTATISSWSADGTLLETRALFDAEGLPAAPWALGLPVSGYPSVQTDRPARMEQA